MNKMAIAVATAGALGLSCVSLASAGAGVSRVRHSERPAIAHMSVVPHPVGHEGGVITLNAALSRARSYTISSSPLLLKLPETFKTVDPSYQLIHVAIAVPANAFSPTGPLPAVSHGAQCSRRLRPGHRFVQGQWQPGAAPDHDHDCRSDHHHRGPDDHDDHRPDDHHHRGPHTTTTAGGTPAVLYLRATPDQLTAAGGLVDLTGDTVHGQPDCVIIETAGPAVTVDSNVGLGIVQCDVPFDIQVLIPSHTPGNGARVYSFALSPDVVGHGGGFPNSVTVDVDQAS